MKYTEVADIMSVKIVGCKFKFIIEFNVSKKKNLKSFCKVYFANC